MATSIKKNSCQAIANVISKVITKVLATSRITNLSKIVLTREILIKTIIIKTEMIKAIICHIETIQ